jgi:hypothetical protein
MPANVAWFERLMFVAILLGLTDIYTTARRGGVSFPSGVAAAVILTGVYVVLIWLAARRRKSWPRYVLAVLFVLTLAAALVSLPTDLRERPFDVLVNGLQCLAEAVALVLVFTGNARAWFAQPVAGPGQSPPSG